jgi:serine protease inhibitor
MMSRRRTMKTAWAFGIAAISLSGCGGSGDTADSRFGTGSGMMRNVTPAAVERATRSLATGRASLVPIASNEFGFRLFAELVKKQQDTNVVISPASLSTVLAIAYNGAAGSTREAMAKTLSVEGISLEDLNEGEKQMLTLLSAPDPKLELDIASSLWAKSGTEFRREFLGRVEDSYAAKPTVLDFASPECAKTINDWVSQATRGRITEMVKQVDPDSAMLLINAISFKGAWKDPFDPARTELRDFTAFGGKKKKASLMSRNGDFSFYTGKGFRAVRLPFGAARIAMVVVLPDETTPLKDVVKQLSAKSWSGMADKFKPSPGLVMLPKFRIEFGAGLMEALRTLGMGVAFSDAADFSGIRQERGLFLRDVMHRATILVDEKGAEAAAAAKVEVSESAAPIERKEVQFIVDRPFAWAIVDRDTGLVLFLGVIGDPVWAEEPKEPKAP